MHFTPRDGLSGQMTGTFAADGFVQSGGGPYSATLNDEGWRDSHIYLQLDREIPSQKQVRRASHRN